jgi:polysaccharide export outer membrane protein
MSHAKRLLLRTFSILLAFSMSLAPVVAQTTSQIKAAEAKDSRSAATTSKAAGTAASSYKTSKKHASKGITARTILEGKKDNKDKKSKPTNARSVGGVGGDNGYPPLLIGPGDLLDIAVYGEEELPLEYQVDATGIITYPYVGNVYLSGMTPAEASDKMARLLAKPRKVTVLIKESNTYWVSVMGHVDKPGKYQIRGRPTLLSALAEAGGTLPGAKLSSSILIHKGYKTKVDLDRFLKGSGEIGPEPLLYPGDALVVPKSGKPSMGELAIVASILASLAVVAVELNNISKK